MPDEVYMSWGDYSHEVAGFRVRCAALTAANFDAQATLRNNLQVELLPILSGQVKKLTVTVIDGENPGWPSDQSAQRESKFLVTYVGVNDKTYRCELPTADLGVADILQAGSDLVDLAHADVADFITAFEALVVDEAETAVTITEMRFVGRNT